MAAELPRAVSNVLSLGGKRKKKKEKKKKILRDRCARKGIFVMLD